MDSRPGSPRYAVHLGGNFAQPTLAFEASWLSNETDRITSYLGNRNCGAPLTSQEEQQAELAALRATDADAKTVVLQSLKRDLNIQDERFFGAPLGSTKIAGSVYV